ncbi:MAG: CehA/McbA family metallohydrolase [bacterium]|nr:CehA/McbA family metallohydrolase [bacterium]
MPVSPPDSRPAAVRVAARIRRRVLLIAILAFSMLVALGFERNQARFVRRIGWIGQGQWLRADLHTHTKFSDGTFPAKVVVRSAVAQGCDALAITDHADYKLDAATPEYFAEIERLRGENPELVLFAGLEWNVPPHWKEEHATVLVAPHREHLLTEFKRRFDDLSKVTRDPELADAALRWLERQTAIDAGKPVVFYNHPSRRREDVLSIVDEIQRLHTTSEILTGFSGAPGHQKTRQTGLYRWFVRPIDRWDPAAAEVGGAWDILLGRGYDVWAARAPSDFHHGARSKPAKDYWPCEFSETWIYVPERSAEGVLRALHAGSFFGVHGKIAREVELTVNAAGLDRPAHSGEVIEARIGSSVTVELRVEIPEADWEGAENRLNRVELIRVTDDGAEVVLAQTPAAQGPALRQELEVPPGGMVLRARGRRMNVGGDDFLFYTNPVRVLAPGRGNAIVFSPRDLR